MDEDELRELEDPEMWEEMEDALHGPSPNPGADVVVPLSVDEVGQVEAQARRRGMRFIEYMRWAALHGGDQVAAALPLDDRLTSGSSDRIP